MKVKYIIIHCSASDLAEDDSFEAIHNLHKAPTNEEVSWGGKKISGKGWKGCGYQYVITKDGKLHYGRGDTAVGAHTKGYNVGSIGVCLTGNKMFSPAQFKTLGELVSRKKDEHCIRNTDIQPHSAFNRNKTCPNFDTVEALSGFIAETDSQRIIEDKTEGSVQDSIVKMSDLVNRQKHNSVITTFDQDKIARLKSALRDKVLLLGQETTLNNGMTADWTHFEFMLSYMKWPSSVTRLTVLQDFWGEFWKYLKPLVDGFERNTGYLYHLIEDQDAVLKDSADDIFELKIYEMYFRDKAAEFVQQQFKVFREVEMGKIQARVQKKKEELEQEQNDET